MGFINKGINMTTLNAPHLNPLPAGKRKMIAIPLSLKGEGQGEGEIEAYQAAHFVKEDCNQFSIPINRYRMSK